MLLPFELYSFIGVIAGFITGFLGVGGGIILVPLLSLSLFYVAGIPQDLGLHFAVGTAALVGLVNTILSAATYKSHDKINWQLFKIFLPGLIFGALVGIMLANILNAHVLSFIISGFLLLILYWSFRRPKLVTAHPGSVSRPKTLTAAFSIATLSCIIGSSGSTFTVPYLMRNHLSLQEAIGTALPCSVPLAVLATVGFISSNPGNAFTYWHTGFIYWPALMGVLATNMVFTRVGSRFSHHVPEHLIQKIFVILLCSLAIKMFLNGLMQ